MLRPTASSARRVAGIGSSSMITGSPAVTVRLSMRASGVRPCAFSARSVTISTPRRAVADLAGVAGGDHAVRNERLRPAKPFQRGVVADALVAVVAAVVVAVDRRERRRSRARTRRPPSPRRPCGGCRARRRRAPRARSRISAPSSRRRVNWLNSFDAVAVLDRLRPRADADPGLHRQDDRRSHRHAGHAFDAGGDDHVLRAAHHRLGGEMDRLLRAAALAVDADRPERCPEASRPAPCCGRCGTPARRPG